MSSELVAPNEGSASTSREIADELAKACDRLRRIDYNALNPNELDELLATFHTMQDMCLRYREQQRQLRGDDSGNE